LQRGCFFRLCSNRNISQCIGLRFFVRSLLFQPRNPPNLQTFYLRVVPGDMSTPGPYCNPFLINMIYAQALPVAYPSAIPAAFSDMNGAPLQTTTQKDFLDRAKLLLMAEMDKPSSIPTIQGLLILAGSECSRGNSSAGWLYAGMVSGLESRLMIDRSRVLICSSVSYRLIG
jgi:hypothetical protein